MNNTMLLAIKEAIDRNTAAIDRQTMMMAYLHGNNDQGVGRDDAVGIFNGILESQRKYEDERYKKDLKEDSIGVYLKEREGEL